MSIFDSLAEQRYQDWLEKVSSPDYVPSPRVAETVTRKTYEGHIFSEVLRYLDKAASGSGTKRARFLEKARQLELQLVILLERRGMPYAIATLRASIDRYRQDIEREGIG